MGRQQQPLQEPHALRQSERVPVVCPWSQPTFQLLYWKNWLARFCRVSACLSFAELPARLGKPHRRPENSAVSASSRRRLAHDCLIHKLVTS